MLGAPIGSAVGQALGWRFTFWTLVVLGGAALLGLIATLPADRRAASSHEEGHEHDHSHAHGHVLAPQHAHEHAQAHTSGGHPQHAPAGGTSTHAADTEGLDAHALAHLGGAGHGPTMREQLQALRRPAV